MRIEKIKEDDRRYFVCWECGDSYPIVCISGDWDTEPLLRLCRTCFRELQAVFSDRLQLLIKLGEEI